MKKLTVFLLSLAVIFGGAGTLNALSFNFEKTGDWRFSNNISHSWAFKLDKLAQVNSVGLSISFIDDERDRREREYANLFSDGYQIGNHFEVDSGERTWNLFSGRRFNLRMYGNGGDFRVMRLKLFGQYRDAPSPTSIPEPETMLMLGSVLLGLVAVSRKRFNQRI